MEQQHNVHGSKGADTVVIFNVWNASGMCVVYIGIGRVTTHVHIVIFKAILYNTVQF